MLLLHACCIGSARRRLLGASERDHEQRWEITAGPGVHRIWLSALGILTLPDRKGNTRQGKASVHAFHSQPHVHPIPIPRASSKKGGQESKKRRSEGQT